MVSVGIMDGRLKRRDYLISLTQIQMHSNPLSIYFRKHNIFHRTLDLFYLRSEMTMCVHSVFLSSLLEKTGF